MKKLTKRSKKGFTLVELIVVIAILAILAGIAIPVYSNYISKANEAADLTALDAVKTATVFAYTQAQVDAGNYDDVDVTSIAYADKGTTAVVNGDDAHPVTITDYTDAVTFKSTTYSGKTVYWAGDAWSLTAPASGDDTTEPTEP